jgi:hypothetical protein
MPINIYNINTHSDLENFNHVVALNLDEMKSFIDEVSDNLSIEFVDEKYFGIIAALLNVELNKNEDPNLQRQQLRTALDTIRSKGTVECFKVFMYNFGLTVDIIPLWTPDYYEELEVVPPYIKVDYFDPMATGLYPITVINPDQQIQTVEKLFTIIA